MGAVFLEIFAAINVAFKFELVVNWGLDRGELVKISHRPGPVHDFLSPPQWLIRVFGAIAEPPPDRLEPRASKIAQRCLAGRQLIGDVLIRRPISLHRFAQKLQRCRVRGEGLQSSETTKPPSRSHGEAPLTEPSTTHRRANPRTIGGFRRAPVPYPVLEG